MKILEGDCRETLRTLPDNSLDSCLTDPPYALVSVVKRFGSPTAAPAKGNDAYMRASAGFMGKTWDNGETAFDPAFWFELLRVLKPGAYLAAFGATRGYHRMACAIEDAGFEIRDSLAWMYGTGFPKSRNMGKAIDQELGATREIVGYDSAKATQQTSKSGTGTLGDFAGNSGAITAPATPAAREWQGWGTALKPAFEPIVLARKPLSESTVAANVLRWRTGALNIDACRVGIDPAADASQLRTMSRGKRTDDTSGQTWGMSKSGGDTPQVIRPDGRWPANVVHDGSDEVIAAFPITHGAGKARTGGQSEQHAEGGMFKVGNHDGNGMRYGDNGGSASRFFYSAKASKHDRNGSRHPTVKPVSLMQWLARLITPPGGSVLDPFAGSGTTGAACALEGFNCVMCEREAEYVADIRRRLFAPAFPWTPKMPWEI